MKTTVNIPALELKELRQRAGAYGMSVAQLIRGMARYLLINEDNHHLNEFLQGEAREEYERRAAVGRKVMTARWGKAKS